MSEKYLTSSSCLIPSEFLRSSLFLSSLPEEAFKIKNIDTGEEIDLRDENKEIFSYRASKLIGTNDNFFKDRRKMNEALWEAVDRNDIDQVEKLINKKLYGNIAAHPNAKGLNDWNSLHMAASDGLADITKILITKGDHTDVDARTTMNRTPLHLAVLHNHLEVVKVLIYHNADINSIDNEFNTPLHYSAALGYYELVSWLLSQNPKVDIQNYLNRKPQDLSLNYTIYQLFQDFIIKKNLENKPSLYTRTILGNTLLHNSREDHVNKILLKASNAPRVRDLQTFNDRPKLRAAKMKKISLKDMNFPIVKVGVKDFKVLMQLGKGSFGEVYLVEKIDTGSQYALKVLMKDKIMGSNLIKYAFAERNILLSVSHPFIVRLDYAFQTADKLALVMEYCPNGDLGMHISREQRFEEEKARFYASEVLLALEELHKNGIIFRDLKPDNVVVDKEGHIKLTDFGLSKEGLYEGQFAKSFCGSVAYLAPEMIKRTGHTRSVDWYLFGVLIYEMLIGTPPYYSSCRDQLFNNIQTGRLRFPKQVSTIARDLIKCLLHRDPSKRLGSGAGDAEEVKSHMFFKDTNWAEVLSKNVTPAPFRFMKKVYKEVSIEKIFASGGDFEDNPRLNGWSILHPSPESV